MNWLARTIVLLVIPGSLVGCATKGTAQRVGRDDPIEIQLHLWEIALWELEYGLADKAGGDLLQGRIATHNVRVQRGREYALVGVCDEWCSDVDLALFDASGELVRMDVLTDDIPVLRFEARASGSYLLAVSMERCSAFGSCRYGVALFNKEQHSTG